MPPVYYRVSHSEAVAGEFRRLLDTARAEGRLPIALRAARYALDELAYDPLAFGESRDYLAAADLRMRIAFARPVCVEFAVREADRIVFVRRFGLVR